MDNRFLRNEMLFGSSVTEILSEKKVVVFGVGGVGGYAVEALARAGIGNIDIVDNDVVDITNINRQIIALESTVGKPKVEVAKDRILEINPHCVVNAIKLFFLPENADSFDFSEYDYIIDAVDTVSAKLSIAEKANKSDTPLISCMGTGNKLDPTKFYITDIFKTSTDPIAKIMRNECRKRGIERLKVVCSTEPPIKIPENKNTPASNPFVPPVAGFIMAGEVIKELARG